MARGRVRIVGSVLVRNEDLHLDRAVRNVALFCDAIHVVDHMSNDDTWEIVTALARDFDHIDARRSRNSAVAHDLLASYAGTATWVIGVDGDEIFDPAGLGLLRKSLMEGEHVDVFRIKAHVLNCDDLDLVAGSASGWLAPPSRPVTKLFNFGAVESWTGSPDPLQSGNVVFRPGYDWETRKDLASVTDWATDPLRMLHVCFLRRSSRESDVSVAGRKNLDESRAYDRSAVGRLKAAVSRSRRGAHLAELEHRGTNWKREWYARGERVTVDAAPFFRV